MFEIMKIFNSKVQILYEDWKYMNWNVVIKTMKMKKIDLGLRKIKTSENFLLNAKKNNAIKPEEIFIILIPHWGNY